MPTSASNAAWIDALDRKLIEVFPGRVVRKDLVQRLKVGFSIPVYVLEYLLGRFCSSTDEEEIDKGVAQVKDMIKERIVRSDQAELVKARLQQHRQIKLIDLVTVNFDETDQGGKYWARLGTAGLEKVHIDERTVYSHERTLTGGVWANVEVAFDDTIIHRGVTRPFVLRRMQPIQIASATLGELIESRKSFTRDEWIDVLVRTLGYEPTRPEITHRRKLLYLLRLVPLVERNYNLIELGPKETGKSFAFRELSPYVTLLSGGQGSVTDLFGWKNRRDKPGLVVKYDAVAFDEIAGPNFKSANDKDMYKGYMEQGSFSRGDDKGTISAEAGIVFNGNTHGDIESLIATSHLFSSLPETIRDDDAFHDRWHAYLPGWEMAKLTPPLFTSHLGFVADYLAELFHNELRPLNFTDAYEQHFKFGSRLGHRDRKAVMRTLSGYIKLLHPDGELTRDEMREYLEFAMEMRRRVKEQLARINPAEFTSAELSYADRVTKQERVVSCPETARRGTGPENDGDELPEDEGETDAPLEVFGNYDLLESFDAGGMAEAFRALDRRSGRTVFLKRVHTRPSERDALEREVRIYEKLMRCQCEHVLQVLDFVREDDHLALVTEFADGGDLQSYVEGSGPGTGLQVREVRDIADNVASALEELHGFGVVHRDLKPQNVLRVGTAWKLADFGIAKNLARVVTQRTFQQYGTPGYMAPEQIQGVEARPSADVYSFGKLLVYLLTGQTDVDRVMYPAWHRLIAACVQPIPANRPTLAAVRKDLEMIPA